MRVRILSAVLLLIVAYIPFTTHAGLLCKGGSDQITPDSTTAGNPTVIKFIVETAGSACGPIKGRYTELSLHYKLKPQDTYATLPATPIALPENYRRAASDALQFEAYEFTIPPYLGETTGEIEYYIDSTFDGYANKAKGYKTIKVVSPKNN